MISNITVDSHYTIFQFCLRVGQVHMLNTEVRGLVVLLEYFIVVVAIYISVPSILRRTPQQLNCYGRYSPQTSRQKGLGALVSTLSLHPSYRGYGFQITNTRCIQLHSTIVAILMTVEYELLYTTSPWELSAISISESGRSDLFKS